MDYVSTFNTLTALRLRMRRRGTTHALLLQRSRLEAALGNHHAALEAAQDAVELQPDESEGHFQEGMCWGHLALLRAGRLPPAPGTAAVPAENVEALLENAAAAFSTSLELCPEDPDTARIMEALERCIASPAQRRPPRPAMGGAT